MIDLKVCDGQDVYLQFKHATYILAVAQGSFIPLSAGTQNEPGPPVLVDRVEGRLRIQDGQPVLSYANPVDPSQQIDFVVDIENVAAAWIKRRISIITQP